MMIRQLADKIWNSGTMMTWGSLVVRIGGLGLLVPLVLTHLDTREVLVWQLLSTVILVIGWADFGFSPTFSRVIAFSRGGGTLADLQQSLPGGQRREIVDGGDDALAIAAVLGTQRVIYRRLVMIAIGVALVVGTGALWQPLGALARPNDGWIAWGCTIVAALLTLLNGANVSILVGFDRIALARRAEAALGVCQLGSTCVVVGLGGGLAAIVGCYSFWAVPLYLVNRRNVRLTALSGSDAAPPCFDQRVFAAVWPAAWRSGVGILMSTGIIQTSGLVYAQIAPTSAAAAYLLALRIFTVISQISQAPFYTRLPAMAQARGQKNQAVVTALAKRGMVLAHSTFVAGAIAAIAFAPYALALIGSSVPWPPTLLTSVLALAFFAERYGAMHMQVYSLTNHIIWHIVNGATGAAMIVLVVMLYPVIGPLAMPTAMLIAYLTICGGYASHKSLQSLGLKRLRFERATALFPGGALLVGLAIANAI